MRGGATEFDRFDAPAAQAAIRFEDSTYLVYVSEPSARIIAKTILRHLNHTAEHLNLSQTNLSSKEQPKKGNKQLAGSRDYTYWAYQAFNGMVMTVSHLLTGQFAP